MLADNRWCWFAGKPDAEACGRELVKLDRQELKLLGNTALELYKLLERWRGWADRWVTAKLDWCAEHLGVSYRSAKRALARLRDCGLVENRRATRQDHRKEVPVWTTRNYYRVWGTWEIRKGKLTVLVPRSSWAKWAEGRRLRGRPVGKKVAPHQISGSNDSGTYGKKMAPISVPITCSYVSLSSKENTRPAVGSVLKMTKTPEPTGDDFSFLDQLNTPTADRPSPRPVQLRIPAMDPIARDFAWGTDSDNMPMEHKVALLAAIYRDALRDHYGVESKAFKFGDIARSKFYGGLKKAVEALAEHAIKPQAWADWKVGKDAAAGRKQPYITMVFSATTITKRRGWFRKDYRGKFRGSQLKITERVKEQLCRIQEIHELNRGRTPQQALSSLPEWYRRMRQAEIAFGQHDPNECFPRNRRG